jgi:hypothetical protein
MVAKSIQGSSDLFRMALTETGQPHNGSLAGLSGRVTETFNQ